MSARRNLVVFTDNFSLLSTLQGYRMRGQKMDQIKFNRELYSKVALIKAAYNFTDTAYIHLDADNEYYYVSLEPKDPSASISESDFINEMLSQAVRHEIYIQTKTIRELMLARAMATSVVTKDDTSPPDRSSEVFSEDEILKDWFLENEETNT